MSYSDSLRRRGFAALLLSILLVAAARPSWAEPHRPISQARINELAGVLLRAHRALIEEPGLRREGERLEPYMDRIAATLPGETSARYVARVDAYVAAIERAVDARNLCVSAPAPRDGSPANVALWNTAVRAEAKLPAQAARVRGAWAAIRRGSPTVAETHGLGSEMAKTILVIKAALEALRSARP
jgi:hypothetical protein